MTADKHPSFMVAGSRAIISRGPFASGLQYGPGARIGQLTADRRELIRRTRLLVLRGLRTSYKRRRTARDKLGPKRPRSTPPARPPTRLDRISQSVLGTLWSKTIFRTWKVCASEGRGNRGLSFRHRLSVRPCRGLSRWDFSSFRLLTLRAPRRSCNFAFALVTWHTNMVYPPALPSKPRMVRIEYLYPCPIHSDALNHSFGHWLHELRWHKLGLG